MKKIGVIYELSKSGPGTKNIIYKSPCDAYTYITYLKICVLSSSGSTLEFIVPNYNKEGSYLLGNIIEYDDKTNKIESMICRDLNDVDASKLVQICSLLMQTKKNTSITDKNYLQNLRDNINIDIIIQSINSELKFRAAVREYKKEIEIDPLKFPIR